MFAQAEIFIGIFQPFTAHTTPVTVADVIGVRSIPFKAVAAAVRGVTASAVQVVRLFFRLGEVPLAEVERVVIAGIDSWHLCSINDRLWRRRLLANQGHTTGK